MSDPAESAQDAVAAQKRRRFIQWWLWIACCSAVGVVGLVSMRAAASGSSGPMVVVWGGLAFEWLFEAVACFSFLRGWSAGRRLLAVTSVLNIVKAVAGPVVFLVLMLIGSGTSASELVIWAVATLLCLRWALTWVRVLRSLRQGARRD